MFSAFDAVLIRPLPYADADRLVRVYGRWLDGSHEHGPLSAGTIRDISERVAAQDLAGRLYDWASDLLKTVKSPIRRDPPDEAPDTIH